jgi:hypothetical protein
MPKYRIGTKNVLRHIFALAESASQTGTPVGNPNPDTTVESELTIVGGIPNE